MKKSKSKRRREPVRQSVAVKGLLSPRHLHGPIKEIAGLLQDIPVDLIGEVMYSLGRLLGQYYIPKNIMHRIDSETELEQCIGREFDLQPPHAPGELQLLAARSKQARARRKSR